MHEFKQTGNADLERRSMIAARIAEAKRVMPNTVSEAPARMPFRSKQQQALMRTRIRLEATLREATGKKGLTMLQLTCMHDLGILALSNWSLQDKELLRERKQKSICATKRDLANSAETRTPYKHPRNWC